MSSTSYLARRQARLAVDVLKRQIIFGFVVSGIALVIGSWRYYIVVGANDGVALALAIAGALGFLLTLAFASAWELPETWLGLAVRTLGGALFAVLLALVYALLIVPVGWLFRRLKGVDPVYSWVRNPPEDMQGWHPKQALYEVNVGRAGKLSAPKRFLDILTFFARQGHYLFLPTLVVLIALGMVLFFVKTSALAPFIYTLF